MFNFYLEQWDLIPDGVTITTHTSQLMPVMTIKDKTKAMLKLTNDISERRGCELMVWWDGVGAAKVLAHEDGAILLERAMGKSSLSTMSADGQDESACRIICNTAKRLHEPRTAPVSTLIPLYHWFRALEPAAQTHGGIMLRCAEIAKELLSTPRDVVVLHGDLHHDNILDFEKAGWLSIDPKGLVGERGFDFANIFTNPDLGNPSYPVAILPKIFEHRLKMVTEMAGLDRKRLLKWIIAWCGLSAAWSFESNDSVSISITLKVAAQAIAELER